MRGKTVVAVLAVAAVLRAVQVEAATGYGLWNAYMLPSAAHLPGALGTFWRTDLFIQNPYTYQSLKVKVWFLPELTNNSSVQPRVFTIPTGGQLVLEDVVATQFGATGKGALLVSTDNSDAFVHVAARTYTGASGTYGQAINGQLGANQAGQRALIAGVRNAAGYRANLGVVNWSSTTVSVQAEVYDSNGSLRGSRSFRLLPWSSEQVSVSSFAGEFRDGYVKLSSTPSPANGWWLAYASVVDNATGDAVYLEDRPDDVYTYRQPSLDLSGRWEGSLSFSAGYQSVDVNIYQYGAYVDAYLYDSSTGFRVAHLSGYEEAGQLVFQGSTNVLQYLGANIWGAARVTSGGSGLVGTFSGTGVYSGGGTFSLSKSWSFAPGDLQRPNILAAPSGVVSPGQSRYSRPPATPGSGM